MFHCGYSYCDVLAPDFWITAAHFIAQCPLKTKFMLPLPEPKVDAGVQSRCQIDCWCDTSRVFDIQKSNHKSNLETFINLFFFLFFLLTVPDIPDLQCTARFVCGKHRRFHFNGTFSICIKWLTVASHDSPGVDSSNTTRFAMYFFYVSLAAATVVTVHVPLTTRE